MDSPPRPPTQPPLDPRIRRLTELAFRQGPGREANRLIQQVRGEVRRAQGAAINYEVPLMDRDWDHVREYVAPRLALYLKQKRLGVFDCAPVFLSVFLGQEIFFVRAADFFEHLRLTQGMSEASFAARARTWESTGRPLQGLPPGPDRGSGP
jgi:hypothetical protein